MLNRGFEIFEFRSRLDKIQLIMHYEKIDALLLTSEFSIRYFTGFSTQFWESPTRPWYLIIPRKGLPKAVIPEIGYSAMKKTWIEEIYTWPSPLREDEGISLVLGLLSKISNKYNNLGAELGKEMFLRMSVMDFLFLKSKIPRMVIDASPLLWKLRMVKSSDEISKIKNICKIVSQSYSNLPKLINHGDTEIDVARKMKIDLVSGGVDNIPFLPITSGREGVSQIICEPTMRTLKNGDILFIDTGSIFDGYFCDFDRNFSIGKASSLVNKAYETLWITTENAINLAKPGLLISDLWKIMYNKLNKHFPNDYSNLRFGHGFGLQLTEPPSITFENHTKLEINMVLTIEPSIEFLPGKILVHEENIVITPDGAQLLTKRAPYKICEID